MGGDASCILLEADVIERFILLGADGIASFIILPEPFVAHKNNYDCQNYSCFAEVAAIILPERFFPSKNNKMAPNEAIFL